MRRTKADAVPVPAGDIVEARTRALMAKTPGLTFGQAMSKVYKDDPTLYERVQAAWRQKAARQDQPR